MFWADPYWRGPLPAADAVLEVWLMGRPTVWVAILRIRAAVDAGRAMSRLSENFQDILACDAAPRWRSLFSDLRPEIDVRHSVKRRRSC